MAEDPEWKPQQDQDMSLLCRVCANQHDYLIPIFQGEGLDHDMPTKMDKHLPIKVRETDKLPTQMCYQCASTIIAWSELHTNCLAADKKLKAMLKMIVKKPSTVETTADSDDVASDHYEDAYDDGGGAADDDDNDDEDFEKEIKQLISDAGVELGSKSKASKRQPARATTSRKRKSELTITPVKREPKKPKTEPSASKSSTALLKPKEEVVTNEDRWVWYCCHCSEHFDNSSLLVTHSAVHNTSYKEICNVCNIAYAVHLKDMSQPNHANIKVEIVEIGHDDEFQYDDEDFFNLPLALDIEDKEEVYVDTFICNYCFVYFSSKSSLKFHLKNSHSELYGNIPTYACNICHNPRRYTREQDIRKHMRAIHNDEATDISCFIRKANPTKLNLQEKRVTNSTYKCIPCNKTYTRSQDIVKHMRFVHMKIGVDPNEYQCKDSLSLINFPEFKIITKVIYNCELCKELFSETDGLDLHMKQEHKLTVSLDFFIAHSVQAYACKLCDESFLSLHELRAHCFQEHGYEEHIFVCPECNEYFLFGSNMVRHLLQVHKEMGWKNKDLLRTIVKKGKEIIDKMFTLKCNVCNKYFKKDRDLYTHMQGFHPEKIDDFTLTEIKKKVNRFKINMKVICSQCDQTFSSKESLIDHLNDHSSNTHTPLCQKCNESLENHNALWSHIFSKHPLGPFVCSVCPLVLNHKVDLMKHIGEIHGILLILENPDDIKKIKNNCKIFIDGILKYKCEECPLIFDSFRSHQRHMYIHKGDTRIICDQCSKQFRSISSLKSHISHVHDNVRRFKCEYCGRAFTCQTNLVQHIRIHTGEKPYVCDECGNRYAQYASLYSHKLTHAQNYCHVCSECGRAFHRISRLKQHMRIHTGDRPPRSHMCDICHKGFRSNSERKRHQQIHNPVRSFVCETCGSRFTLKKYLIQHYKIHREVSEVCIETVTDLGFDVQV